MDKYGVREDGRVVALRTFGIVTKGDVGGFVDGPDNLSQIDTCWIYGDAEARENSRVFGHARLRGKAKLSGSAMISDYVVVDEYAHMAERAYATKSARVTGNSYMYGRSYVTDNAEVGEYTEMMGNAILCGNAKLQGTARMGGASHALENARIGGKAWIRGSVAVQGDAVVEGATRLNGNMRFGGVSKVWDMSHVVTLMSTPVGDLAVVRQADGSAKFSWNGDMFDLGIAFSSCRQPMPAYVLAVEQELKTLAKAIQANW